MNVLNQARRVRAGRIRMPIINYEGIWYTPLIQLCEALGLDRQRFYGVEAKYRVRWGVVKAVFTLDEKAFIGLLLPLKWLDCWLWSLRVPLNLNSKALLDDFRFRWREMVRLDIEAAIPEAEREIAFALRSAQERLVEMEGDIAQLKATLRERISLASAEANALRRGRPVLGPAEFQAIRNASEAGDNLAAQFGCTRNTLNQIRGGTYPATRFRKWLRDMGLTPEPAPTNRDIAAVCWAPATPDWVASLADACDLTSQAQIAKQLGISGAAVNLVLHAKYRGRNDRIEAKVRTELMSD